MYQYAHEPVSTSASLVAASRVLFSRKVDIMDLAFTVHYWISVGFLPCLALLLPPLFLPTKWTGIRGDQRPSGVTRSLLLLSIASCAMSIVNGKTKAMMSTDEETWCEVDTALMVFVTTATIAHLPMIALGFLRSLATPTNPEPAPPSRLRVASTITLIYIYAALPLAPIFALGKRRYPDGFGEWWGFYCIDQGPSKRIIRITTFIPPAIVALGFCFIIAQILYSCIGSLPFARTTWLKWGHFALYTICALGTIGYVIVEQVIGWQADWWPRAFERLPTLIVLLCLYKASIFRTYGYWIRGKRAPTPPAPEYTGRMTFVSLGSQVAPAEMQLPHYIKVSDKLLEEKTTFKDRLSRASSFFAPAAALSALYKPKITQYGDSYHSPSSLAFRDQQLPPSPDPKLLPIAAAYCGALQPVPGHFRNVPIDPPVPIPVPPPSVYLPTTRRPSKKGRKKIPDLKIDAEAASGNATTSPPFTYSTASLATTVTNPYKSPVDDQPTALSSPAASPPSSNHLSPFEKPWTRGARRNVAESTISQYSTMTAENHGETLAKLIGARAKAPREVSFATATSVMNDATTEIPRPKIIPGKSILRGNRI